jgi:hypothetical protein
MEKSLAAVIQSTASQNRSVEICTQEELDKAMFECINYQRTQPFPQ